MQRLEATHAETLAAKDAALGIAQRQLAALREEAGALQRRRTADLEARDVLLGWWLGGLSAEVAASTEMHIPWAGMPLSTGPGRSKTGASPGIPP